MIHVTRLNGQPLIVNAAHIVTVEATPDTVLGLQNGEKLMVRETADEVVAMTTHYLKDLGTGPRLLYGGSTIERVSE